MSVSFQSTDSTSILLGLRGAGHYPSFLKQLNGAVMQQIWRFAAKCIENAQRIDVYRYSLPDSDVGIRALLNVLRFRSQSNEVDLRVHDPRRRIAGDNSLAIELALMVGA
jgi:hypothetical protein